ncbi:MAG: dihydrofolate reductase family protein [Nocardioidaceae bacterium]
MSRKITAHLFCSVNGVVESPNLFQFDSFGPEEGQLMGEAIGGATDVVIGRKLWQEWSEYWPSADDPFGQFINPIRKHVVTSTLGESLGWNSVAIEGDPVSYVQKLKSDDGGDVIVAGGIETVRSVFLAGAIDALTLTIHPAVTNEGRRLFDDTVPLTRLELLDGTVTGAGNAVLTYRLRG